MSLLLEILSGRDATAMAGHDSARESRRVLTRRVAIQAYVRARIRSDESLSVTAASTGDLQVLADEILLLLGVRMQAGQIVIHVSDGRVQKVETNTVHKPTKAIVLDKA